MYSFVDLGGFALPGRRVLVLRPWLMHLAGRPAFRVANLTLAVSALMGACNDSPTPRDFVPPVDASAPQDTGATLPPPEAAAPEAAVASIIPAERAALCARPADDVVRDVFCKGTNTSVASLRELVSRLGVQTLPVDMDEPSAAALTLDLRTLYESAVFLGHSTALSGQLVSPINPRAILLDGKTFIAFQRGVQKVEIATRDRAEVRLNFYLVTFTQACNQRAQGCLPGDLYTLDIERDWTAVTVQDDEDLKNDPLDCRQCHQRGLSRPVLLMRELFGPWPHFFFIENALDPYSAAGGYQAPGKELVVDYLAAKGSESYAGVPSAYLRQTAAATLQRVIRDPQVLQFPPTIPDQLTFSVDAGGPMRSDIWDEAYAAFKRGEHQALPYFLQRATDSTKQAALAAAYSSYLRGETSAAGLPDLADIYPDDPQTRAEIGLQTEPGASPVDTLVQACASCHNDVLDQTVSRARFNVALSRMSRAELDLAITRVGLPEHAEGAMPPAGMRQLDAAGRERLIAYLRQGTRSAEDDALLTQVAALGMAQGNVSY